MAHLTIKNVGPIKYIDIELNKINVIMGPQSSGKSTINKIACYCSWVEKKVSLDQSFDFFWKENSFYNELVRFHKMEGYFSDQSEIEFTSDVVHFVYKHNDEPVRFNWKDKSAYKRTKLSYIPAERNIVSIINDWKEVSLGNNNIRSFMSDWNIARKIYTPESHAHIDYLNIDYYYDSSKDIDYIKNKDGAQIQLINASSGIQSLIPLFVLTKYFSEWIYKNDEPTNVSAVENRDALISKIMINVEEEYNESFISNGELNSRLVDVLSKKVTPFLINHGTNLFIEEPELNLFPLTQKSLLNNLVRNSLLHDKDQLFITTHSPYILYALNNCMMGYLVKDSIPSEDVKDINCRDSWVDPKLVSVWEIKDGELRTFSESINNTIQDKDGLISNNYFDEIMKEVMDDFYKMINYYGDDKDED